MKNRIKQKDESLPALAEDIERLARLSYPDAPESIMDTLARDQFIDALPDEDMRLHLKQERPQTLIRAQEIALELESFQFANRQMRARVRTVKLESEKSNEKKYDKDGSDQEKPAEQNLNTTMLQMMARLEKVTLACVQQMRNTSGTRRRRRSPPREDKKCWHCDASGHMRINCPERSPRPSLTKQASHKGQQTEENREDRQNEVHKSAGNTR